MTFQTNGDLEVEDDEEPKTPSKGTKSSQQKTPLKLVVRSASEPVSALKSLIPTEETSINIQISKSTLSDESKNLTPSKILTPSASIIKEGKQTQKTSDQEYHTSRRSSLSTKSLMKYHTFRNKSKSMGVSSHISKSVSFTHFLKIDQHRPKLHG